MLGAKVTMVIEPEVLNDIRAGAIKVQSLRDKPASSMATMAEAAEAWETSEQLKQTIAHALFERLLGQLEKYQKVNQPVQISLSIEAIS